MRRFVLVVAVALVAAVACMAQVEQIHYRDEATLAWDAVTVDADGQPLLETDVVSYEVYVYDSALLIDDQNPANLVLMGSPVAPELVMTFAGMARRLYYAGVRVVVVDGQGGVTYSQIAWSYDPVATDPTAPFGYIPLAGVLVLPLPRGLRDAGM